MTRSIRTLGLALGAVTLLSGATASSALALNPITVSLNGTELVVNDPTGVDQATFVSTEATNFFRVFEANSNNELKLGAGISRTVQYSNREWVVRPSNGVAITRVRIEGNAGNDGLNTEDLTGIPSWVFGGTGADFIGTGAGDDLINGDEGNDNVRAGSGSDVISGGTGKDILAGGNGDDWFYDKDGFADRVDGGNDYDRFTRDVGLDTATNVEVYSS